MYVVASISSKIPKLQHFQNDIENMFLNINLNKNKWLLCDGYNPNKNKLFLTTQ